MLASYRHLCSLAVASSLTVTHTINFRTICLKASFHLHVYFPTHTHTQTLTQAHMHVVTQFIFEKSLSLRKFRQHTLMLYIWQFPLFLFFILIIGLHCRFVSFPDKTVKVYPWVGNRKYDDLLLGC